jgi:hypothetical protein
MRKEISELQLAVEGKIGERHRFLLSVATASTLGGGKGLAIVEHHIQEKP